MRKRGRCLLFVLLCTSVGASNPPAQPEAPANTGTLLPPQGRASRSPGKLTGPANAGEINSLVRDLGDPSYETRTLATRRLCAIGIPARAALESIVGGEDVEASLRAKALLRVLDELLFAGVELRLSLSKQEIAWDEPVNLTLEVVNSSEYPARIPFERNPATPTASATPARQVGTMLDLADFLRVETDDGRRVELTVDDIAADPDVVAAVQDRLDGGPITTLAPGERMTIVAEAVNRAWARYRLLDAGTVRLRLDYVPEWNDDVLAEAKAGRVTGNEVSLTVSTSAPATVSRQGVPAKLTIRRDDADVVVEVTNSTDQSMFVNRNFGTAVPFAEGRWLWEGEEAHWDVPFLPKPRSTWEDFDGALLTNVTPGGKIELARMPLSNLRALLQDAGADLSTDQWTIAFSYTNLCNRQWQMRPGAELLQNPNAPPILQRLLPRQVLATYQTSNRLAGRELKPD